MKNSRIDVVGIPGHYEFGCDLHIRRQGPVTPAMWQFIVSELAKMDLNKLNYNAQNMIVVSCSVAGEFYK